MPVYPGTCPYPPYVAPAQCPVYQQDPAVPAPYPAYPQDPVFRAQYPGYHTGPEPAGPYPIPHEQQQTRVPAHRRGPQARETQPPHHVEPGPLSAEVTRAGPWLRRPVPEEIRADSRGSRTANRPERRARHREALDSGGTRRSGLGGMWDRLRGISKRPRNRHPFIRSIMDTHISSHQQLPQLPLYSGAGCPDDHVATFEHIMMFHGVSDAAKCRAFPTTLVGTARAWFTGLQDKSIGCFDDLAEHFVARFVSSRRPPKQSGSLLSLVQGTGESLRDYTRRFNTETLEIPELDAQVAIVAYSHGLRTPQLQASLAKKKPRTLSELMRRAEKYINAEDVSEAHQNWPLRAGQGEIRPPTEGGERRPDRKEQGKGEPKGRGGQAYAEYTPLNTRRKNVLYAIQEEPTLRWPRKMQTPPGKRDSSRFCDFHKDFGHLTDDCKNLRDEIEQWVRRGRLDRFTLEERRDGGAGVSGTAGGRGQAAGYGEGASPPDRCARSPSPWPCQGHQCARAYSGGLAPLPEGWVQEARAAPAGRDTPGNAAKSPASGLAMKI